MSELDEKGLHLPKGVGWNGEVWRMEHIRWYRNNTSLTDKPLAVRLTLLESDGGKPTVCVNPGWTGTFPGSGKEVIQVQWMNVDCR